MPDHSTTDLFQIFKGLQAEMVGRMETARKAIEHAPSMGDEGEAEWVELFQHFLPRRYQADTAFIVDCNGRISEQQDVVIFDRQYSPFLAKWKKAHYIPAESVYAVFEVKQDLTAMHVKYAGEKAASVRALHRTTLAIQHAGGTFKPREHFNILAGLLCHSTNWKPTYGKPFDLAIKKLAVAERLDFGCALESGSFFINWETGLPVARFSTKETSLVSFVLGVISALQQLGTVPALDLNAYLNPLLKRPHGKKS
jgi:hypothetical protein